MLEEARKTGGYPLFDPRTGRVAIVPEKVMRCPRCDGMVARKEASKKADRTSPEGSIKDNFILTTYKIAVNECFSCIFAVIGD